MATEFFVVMLKRGDTRVYSDLHKTDGRIYLIEADANKALEEKGDLEHLFQVVRLIALTEGEWEEMK